MSELKLRPTKTKTNFLPRGPGHFFRARENPRAVGGDGHSVLEMRRGLAVGGFRHPLIPHAHFGRASVDHWLYRDDHAFLQPGAASRVTVIREVRLVVHFGADAVPHEFPHYRVTVLLGPALYRVADIAEPISRTHLVDGAIQRLASYIQQLLQLRSNLSHRDGNRRIREVAVYFHPKVDGNNLAFAQLALGRRDSVNDLAIHGSTQHARVAA